MKPENDVGKNQSLLQLERSRNKRAAGVEWSLGNALRPSAGRLDGLTQTASGERLGLENDFMGLLTQSPVVDSRGAAFCSAESISENPKKSRTKNSEYPLNKQRAPNIEGCTSIEFNSSEFGPLQMEVSRQHGLCTVKLVLDRQSGSEGRYRLMASIVEKQLSHRFGEEFKVEFKWQSQKQF